MNLYETLGVSPGADLKTIRAAYKRLAMKHHPDRNGDKVLFQAIQAAYEVLTDPERRAYYDATGSAEREPTPEETAERLKRATALQLIRGSLVKALTTQGVDVDKVDVLDSVRKTLGAALKELQAQHTKQVSQKDKAERAARRVVSDEDTLASILSGLAAEVDGAMAATTREIAQLDLALGILSKAKYTVDIPTEAELEQQYRAQVASIANQVFSKHFGPGRGPFGRGA